jgi:hypothetical protein
MIQRYAEEVAQGLHDKKSKSKKAKPLKSKKQLETNPKTGKSAYSSNPVW